MYKILHHMYKIWIYLDLGTFRHVVKMTSLTSRPTEAGGSVDKKCLLWHSLGPTKNAKNRFCEHLSQYHCIFRLIFPFCFPEHKSQVREDDRLQRRWYWCTAQQWSSISTLLTFCPILMGCQQKKTFAPDGARGTESCI